MSPRSLTQQASGVAEALFARRYRKRRNGRIIADAARPAYCAEKKLALLFDGPIMRYSAASIASVVRKICFGIESNLPAKRGGGAQFANRVSTIPRWFVSKAALFPLYAASVVLPPSTGVRLALLRKRSVYFLHPVLSIALLLILSHQLLGLLFIRSS